MTDSSTKNLRKKFCRDFDIPINIFSDPYYSYFYELYREYLKLDEKQRVFDQALTQLKDVEGLRKSWFELKDKIEADIKALPVYAEYEKTELKYPYTHIKNLEKGNLYNEEGVNLSIVSVDIVKANYTSLKTYSKELVFNSETYVDLVKKYTDLEYYQVSKIFRQLLFEPLNGKKQSQIQKNIMDQMLGSIKNEISPLKIRMVGSDELYLAFDRDIDLAKKEQEVRDLILKLPNHDIFKVEAFRISKVIKDCFIKETTKGEKTLKHVPMNFYAQVFKHFNKQPITEMDRVFIFEGEIATFNQSLFDKDYK